MEGFNDWFYWVVIGLTQKRKPCDPGKAWPMMCSSRRNTCRPLKNHLCPICFNKRTRQKTRKLALPHNRPCDFLMVTVSSDRNAPCKFLQDLESIPAISKDFTTAKGIFYGAWSSWILFWILWKPMCVFTSDPQIQQTPQGCNHLHFTWPFQNAVGSRQGSCLGTFGRTKCRIWLFLFTESFDRYMCSFFSSPISLCFFCVSQERRVNGCRTTLRTCCTCAERRSLCSFCTARLSTVASLKSLTSSPPSAPWVSPQTVQDSLWRRGWKAERPYGLLSLSLWEESLPLHSTGKKQSCDTGHTYLSPFEWCVKLAAAQPEAEWPLWVTLPSLLLWTFVIVVDRPPPEIDLNIDVLVASTLISAFVFAGVRASRGAHVVGCVHRQGGDPRSGQRAWKAQPADGDRRDVQGDPHWPARVRRRRWVCHQPIRSWNKKPESAELKGHCGDTGTRDVDDIVGLNYMRLWSPLQADISLCNALWKTRIWGGSSGRGSLPEKVKRTRNKIFWILERQKQMVKFSRL